MPSPLQIALLLPITPLLAHAWNCDRASHPSTSPSVHPVRVDSLFVTSSNSPCRSHTLFASEVLLEAYHSMSSSVHLCSSSLFCDFFISDPSLGSLPSLPYIYIYIPLWWRNRRSCFGGFLFLFGFFFFWSSISVSPIFPAMTLPAPSCRSVSAALSVPPPTRQCVRTYAPRRQSLPCCR